MTLITVRKGTSSQWSAANPVLASGEPGFDLTNSLFKVGDGSSTWSGLSYYGSGLFSEIDHSHTISNIINFASGVSGFLPVKNITASTGIFVNEVDGVYNIAVTGNFGFNGSEIDSRVSGYLQAGSGIVFNYNNNMLTIYSNLVSPPQSGTASGIIGQFAYDSEYFYICTNTNFWKRTGLNSW